MNYEDLDKIQNQLLGNIDEENATDKEIKEKALTIASALVTLSTPYRAKVGNVLYSFSMVRVDSKHIQIHAANVANQTISPNYIPYIVNCELNSEATFKGNVSAAVEAFIRHITGNIKAEMIDDNDNKELN